MRKLVYVLRGMSLIALFVFFFTKTFAQSLGTIRGSVKDANGAILSGASVTVEGERGGTLTDAAGNFSLRVRPGSRTLVISFVGQSPQRFPITVVSGETVQQDATLSQVSDLSGVIVVGSRSRVPRSRLTTTVPVDVINAREIKQFAQADVSQMLTYVAPSFQSNRQTISDGTDHIDPAGLRGLGPDQTLVLLNGKRRHTTALVNINGTVGRGSVGTDLNTIPASAIERIEVLRDGASAQYGSDAIAGVINIVLKKSYKGLSVSGMAGQNFTNMPYAGGDRIQDGFTRQFDFSGGYGWKNGAYVNASGQWLKRDQSNRSGIDNIPLIYYGNGGGLPPASAVPAGVSPTDYYRWLIDLDKDTTSKVGYSRRNLVAGNSANENLGVFINGGIPVTSKIDFYITAGISHRTGFASGFSRNPNSWSQQPVVTSGRRFYPDGFLPEIHTTLNDKSVLSGLKFNLGEWELDVSNARGENTIRYDIRNTGNSSLPASDNVQTEFSAGDLEFMQNTLNLDLDRKFDMTSSRSLNVAVGAEYRYERFRIKEGERNSYINGGRRFQPDPIPPYPGTSAYFTFSPGTAVSGSQVFPGFQPADAVSAKRSIYAAYGDLEFSGQKYIIGLAARFETYDEFQVNYDNLSTKLTGRYELTKQIAVRGSFTTGFRAPSLHQRNFQNTSTQFVGGLPSQALTANNYNPIVKNAFGIQSLTPEKSRSFSAGVVGNITDNITYTVDAYWIDIDDRIVLSTQFNRSNPLVQKILVDNNVDPTVSALQFWTNAVDTRTKGIDVVLTNRFRLGNGNANFSIAGNFNENEVVGKINTNSVIDRTENNPSETDPTKNPANDLRTSLFDRLQRSRIEVAQPRSKVNISLTYDIRKFNFLLRTVRFGEVQFLNNVDPFAKQPNGTYFNDVGFGTDQTFSPKWVTDAVVTVKAIRGLSVSIGANNVFDVYPDRIFIDPRNDPSAYYATPVATTTTNKTIGGFNAARDASNRGRFLFTTNQFGFNGRYLFARLNIDLFEIGKRVQKTVDTTN